MVFIILYLLLTIVAAAACSFIQCLRRVYIRDYSSFITSGSIYRYNYVMYFIGLALFILILGLGYKLIVAKHLETTVLSRMDKVLAVIASIVVVILMLSALVFEAFILFGMTDKIGPDALFYATFLGWPIMTMVFMLYKISIDL